jgi:2-iminobutanoate/2-iminopropanoate deaminase
MSSPLEFIQPKDRYKGDVSLSLAVKAGTLLFVSGVPAFDGQGKLAIGDFPAQMRQVMENIAAILKAAGTDWSRVVRTRVLLTREEDFHHMNRAFATYFPGGQYPARTTMYVKALPQADFLLEIECDAVLA